MRNVSIVLLLISVILSMKHGWDAFQPLSAEQTKLINNLGITKTSLPFFGIISIPIGIMLFLPQTF